MLGYSKYEETKFDYHALTDGVTTGVLSGELFAGDGGDCRNAIATIYPSVEAFHYVPPIAAQNSLPAGCIAHKKSDGTISSMFNPFASSVPCGMTVSTEIYECVVKRPHYATLSGTEIDAGGHALADPSHLNFESKEYTPDLCCQVPNPHLLRHTYSDTSALFPPCSHLVPVK